MMQVRDKLVPLVWLAELFGIQGDIMTIAKALSSGYAPIAAAVVSARS